MELYKIGLDATSDTSALLNNSALYEFNRLKSILDTIDCDDFICILNGITNKEFILPKNKKKIFIATDGFCFDKNKDIIDECDYILHQSEQRLDFIHKPQAYNFVPFLFTNDEPKSVIQDSKVVFGGANRGRDDKIKKYILDGFTINPNVVAFLKMYDGDGKVIFDNRIEYGEFIKVLRSYKYTICFSRKEYDEMQWTTARFFESISNYTLPFVDSTYCVHSLFNGMVDVVTSYEEMCDKINNMHEQERLNKIILLNEIVMAYKDAFKDTILSIIS